MEPTFVGTPFAQASSPSSRQIRAWLDEQEAGYTQWRAGRKPVAHTFATAKLNSPLRALPRVAKSAAPHTPLWLTLSNQAAEAEAKKKPETPNGARSTPPERGSISTNLSSAIETSTLQSAASRRSSMSTPTLPAIAKREAAGSYAAASRKSVRPSDLPLVARTRTSALAKQRLQEHLYAFHSRQVFSFARSADEENEAEQQDCWSETSEVVAEHTPGADLLFDTHSPAPLSSRGASEIWSSTTTTSSSVGTPTAPAMLLGRRQQQQEDDYVLQGLSFVSEADCARIFEHDWRLSDVERVVRDAVERKRIHQILRRSYRVLLWFFRFYAGKSGLAAGAGAVSSAHALFQIADKLKLLEDLNVQCVDPGRFGITDTPLARDGLVGFLLSVARMTSSHGQNPARLRVLVAEGVEVSDAMSTLVRDYFGVFAQIQDADHFRNVFLRKTPSVGGAFLKSAVAATTRTPRRIQDVLEQHMENLHNFFSAIVRRGLGTSTAASDPGVSAAPAPLNDPQPSVSFAQFLSTLRALGLIANANAKPSSSSLPTQQTTAASAPVAIEEGRALRAFLSCLGMSESECSERGATASTREATFPQFVEALLRVALLQRELVICRGQYDVCPGELASELCCCGPERAQHDFRAFDDAVEELFDAIHASHLGRARQRASLKMQTLSSLHYHHNTVHKLSSSGGGAQRATSQLLFLSPTNQ